MPPRAGDGSVKFRRPQFADRFTSTVDLHAEGNPGVAW